MSLSREVAEVVEALNAIDDADAEEALELLIGMDYPLKACHYAGMISDANEAFAKMLNRQFREDAAKMMMGREYG